jgi:hypothetical protein
VGTNCRRAGTSSAGRTPGGQNHGARCPYTFFTRFLGRDYDITIGDGPHTDVVVHARTDDKGTKLALCRCNDTYGPTCQFFFNTFLSLRHPVRAAGGFPANVFGNLSRTPVRSTVSEWMGMTVDYWIATDFWQLWSKISSFI